MRAKRARTLGLALVLALGACSDAPTSVPLSTPEPARSTLLELDADLLDGPAGSVLVLRRTTPLDSDEVVTRTIGALGGTITLPRAGLKLVVPAGALLSSRTITVTAPAGNRVGYHFQPHGLQFLLPVTAVQTLDEKQLQFLQVPGLTPLAAYFSGDLQPRVTALERLSLDVSLLGRATFQIRHFSGYVIATD